MLEENPKKCSLMSGLKKLKKYNAVLCPTLFKEKISLSLIAKLWLKDKYNIQVTHENNTSHSTISLL